MLWTKVASALEALRGRYLHKDAISSGEQVSSGEILTLRCGNLRDDMCSLADTV